MAEAFTGCITFLCPINSASMLKEHKFREFHYKWLTSCTKLANEHRRYWRKSCKYWRATQLKPRQIRRCRQQQHTMHVVIQHNFSAAHNCWLNAATETAGDHARREITAFTRIPDYDDDGLESLAVNGFQSFVLVLFLRDPHLLKSVKAS